MVFGGARGTIRLLRVCQRATFVHLRPKNDFRAVPEDEGLYDARRRDRPPSVSVGVHRCPSVSDGVRRLACRREPRARMWAVDLRHHKSRHITAIHRVSPHVRSIRQITTSSSHVTSWRDRQIFRDIDGRILTDRFVVATVRPGHVLRPASHVPRRRIP